MKFINKIIKKSKKSKDKLITIFLIIAILGVLNLLATRIFTRFDLTQNKLYSISKVSKDILKDLDDIVNIRLYFSKSLPVQYQNTKREIVDLLTEYENYSDGKLKVEVIDPVEMDDSEIELAQIGIPMIQVQAFKNDSFQMIQGYMAMSIEYGSNLEVIPVIEGTRNLEYDITKNIKKVMTVETPVVAWLTSNGTIPFDQVKETKARLEEIYSIAELDLSIEGEIPDYIDTLAIVKPMEAFEEEALKKIDNFVMKGKSLIILADGVKIGNKMVAEKNELGLNNLLTKYGVEINNNLILDVAQGMAPMSSGFGTIYQKYAFWPRVVSSNFDKNNSVVSGLESLVLPWASSISIEEKAGTEISYLAKTTSHAWEQSGTFNLDPRQSFPDNGGSDQYILAVLLSGEIKSAFGEETTQEAKIAVIGDGDLLADNLLTQSFDNVIFFQNLVDGLTVDNDLITIRSKEIHERPIKNIEKSTKDIIKYLNIFGVTILVLTFGISRYFFRRKNEFIDES